MENTEDHMIFEDAKDLKWKDTITALVTNEKRGITKGKNYEVLMISIFDYIKEVIIYHRNNSCEEYQRSAKSGEIIRFNEIPAWWSNYKLFSVNSKYCGKKLPLPSSLE